MKNIKIYEVYKTLSEIQKNNFWASVINIFLIVFTFWLGLTIQFMIVDTNAKYNNQLIRLEYNEKISHDYEKFLYYQQLFNNDIAQLIKGSKTEQYVRMVSLSPDKMLVYANTVDSIVQYATKLSWSVPNNHIKVLRNELLMVSSLNGILKVYLNNTQETLSVNDVEKYFQSEDFIKTNKIILPSDDSFIQEVTNIVKGWYAPSLNYNSYFLKLLSTNYEYIINITKIINFAFHNVPITTFDKVVVFWNDIPNVLKSIIALVLLIIIGIIFANYYLKSMSFPSKNKMYSKDEYDQLKNEKLKLKEEIVMLESLILQNTAIIETQAKQIKNLELNLDVKEENYIKILSELGEKNRKIRHLEEYNKALILGLDNFES